MKKILLPPLFLLLLVACSDTSSIVSAGVRAPRYDVIESVDPSISAVGGRVLPAAFATQMADVNNSFPHARANMRYQQVFLGSELGDLEQIAGLCLRHDDTAAGPQLTQQLTIKLGPTQMDNTNLGNTFATNYSATPTEVFSGSVVIPGTTGAGTIDSFDFCVEFTTTYTHPAGSNLIVEIVNTSTSSSNHPKDACSAGSTGCTTRRVLAFSATATTATLADNSGLVMSFLSTDPTAKIDCWDDQWVDYGFKNLGQCIRFVETGKDSRE